MTFRNAVQVLCTFAPSSLRLWVWRRLGFRIAGHCRVSPLSLIVADHIDLGHGAVIEAFTLIYQPAVLRMGERSRISSFVRVVGHGEMHMGPQSHIALANLIDVTRGYAFRLGARSGIAPRCIFYTHGISPLIFNMGYPHRKADIAIGEDCWIGMACIVLAGSKLGDRAVVLPGVTVRADVASDTVLAPQVSVRSFAARLLRGTQGGTDADKLELMRDFFSRHAATHGHNVVRRESQWSVDLPRGRRLILRLGEGPAQTGDLPPEALVVWRLAAGESGPIPVFVFSELTVHGRHTDFAERMAVYLSEECGIPFRFLEL